jgi:hypothetical protein
MIQRSRDWVESPFERLSYWTTVLQVISVLKAIWTRARARRVAKPVWRRKGSSTPRRHSPVPCVEPLQAS